MSHVHYDLEIPSVSAAMQARPLYASAAKYDDDWHSILHTHNCTEIFYVAGGKGQFKIRDRLLPVSTGDLLIVNPNVEHTEMSLEANPMEYLVWGVSGLELGNGETGYTLLHFKSSGEDILPLLRSTLTEMEKRLPGYELICQDLLETVLIRLMRRPDFALSAAPTQSRGSKECAAVRRYIEGHFKENISLDNLADFAHVSKYYLVHTFNREYGVSPISYLISRRIQESKHLLANTNYSLNQIAQMLGFSSPSYFSQRFRKAEGITPMEYRQRCRKNSPGL